MDCTSGVVIFIDTVVYRSSSLHCYLMNNGQKPSWPFTIAVINNIYLHSVNDTERMLPYCQAQISAFIIFSHLLLHVDNNKFL